MADIRIEPVNFQGKDVDIDPVSVYDGRYYLYDMTMKYDYDVHAVIRNFTEQKEKYKSGGSSVDIESSNAVKKALGMTTDKEINFDLFGCTAFSVKSSEKSVYMGRNYDYATNTSCVLVRCNPRPQVIGERTYKSIACAASSSLTMEQFANEDETIFKFLPFVCLDGINEKGVSIAILVAGNKEEMYPTYQVADGSNIFTTLAVRLVLDCAESTAEAITLLKGYNMFANGSKDYHFFISDMTGDSRIVEYDYRSDSRQMVVTKNDVVTNFYIYDENHFGHGYDRYKTVKEILAKSKIESTECWDALEKSSQKYKAGDPTSNTQWSILFNNTNQSAEIAIRRHFDKKQRKSFYIK